jgi:hypothetical protein
MRAVAELDQEIPKCCPFLYKQRVHSRVTKSPSLADPEPNESSTDPLAVS